MNPLAFPCSSVQCLPKSCLNPLMVEIHEQADFFAHTTLAFGDDMGVLVPHVRVAFLCGEVMRLGQV